MPEPTTRSTYHHGDLRNALLDAGARLAERGGPDAVGVRAAAREVGVSPTAAYRHFENADDLLLGVKERAFQALTDAMRARLATVPDTGDAGETATRRLEALGRAYVGIALAEPGLFRVAFCEKGALPFDDLPNALAMVAQVMDDLVAAGRLPAERRPLAEIAAWAAVHGVARLALDGPLANVAPELFAASVDRVIDMTLRGLTGEGTTA
ncbi:TetR/AcrR family transcriptional regulator [Jiangella aurantiaca]|uniref:TetR/AcrR family transcriptional regulator n=1 Tax=Jiangella aurantiaca TaxID=2530373 RepID=A0A4R5A4M7_9ACTN|nr:TetR/AcrR family transcriptional regulator [Jiangella aurantiaca]TDD65629.1 TetR/AcrR family transcriptional regulator [Jiangella aurantiaca]